MYSLLGGQLTGVLDSPSVKLYLLILAQQSTVKVGLRKRGRMAGQKSAEPTSPFGSCRGRSREEERGWGRIYQERVENNSGARQCSARAQAGQLSVWYIVFTWPSTVMGAEIKSRNSNGSKDSGRGQFEEHGRAGRSLRLPARLIAEVWRKLFSQLNSIWLMEDPENPFFARGGLHESNTASLH